MTTTQDNNSTPVPSNIEELNASYQRHLSVYKEQFNNLKLNDQLSREKIERLEDEISKMRRILDIAKQSNEDLELAYRTIHDDNLRLKGQMVACTNSQTQQSRLQLNSNSENLERLEQQLIDLMNEKTCWIDERDKLRQKTGYLERECRRFQTENRVLARQVQHLVKTLEEERGMTLRSREDVNKMSSQITAGDVIDERLVTFESLAELQQKNQQILGLCKELAARNEDLETKIQEGDLGSLKAEICDLKCNLDEAKEERLRQTKLIKNLNQQRDLFKILLTKTRQVEHLTPEIFQQMVTVACLASPAITGSTEIAIPQDAVHVQELQEQIEWLKNETKALREAKDKEKNEHQETLTAYMRLNEQLNEKTIQLTCQLEEYVKVNDLLKKNLENKMEECEEFKLKSIKLSEEHLAHIELMKEEKKAGEAAQAKLQTIVDEQSNLIHNLRNEVAAIGDLSTRIAKLKRRNRNIAQTLIHERDRFSQLQDNKIVDSKEEINNSTNEEQSILVQSLRNEVAVNQDLLKRIDRLKRRNRNIAQTLIKERNRISLSQEEQNNDDDESKEEMNETQEEQNNGDDESKEEMNETQEEQNNGDDESKEEMNESIL